MFSKALIVVASCIALGQSSTFINTEEIQSSSRVKRSGFIQLSWTRNERQGVVLVYSNDFSSQEVSLIQSAVNEVSKYSCVPITLHSYNKYSNNFRSRLFKNVVLITKMANRGCNSDIGMKGGLQRLNLDPFQYWNYGTIVHELMHVLGYDHEMNRPDRDQFVQIHFNNVIRGFENNFVIKRASRTIGPYDVNSILHYPARAYAVNQNYPTITSRVQGITVPINIIQKLSFLDIYKIKYITGCKM